MTHIGQRYFWSLLVFLLMLPVMGTAFSANPICAEVKIVIEQKLSFERQAFDAKMVINNGLDTSKIENVDVELMFLDSNNKTVVATQDPNATGAKFFYRTDSMSGINEINGNGVVAAKSAAEIHWMIIPSAGAAGASGTLYYVGAKVTYTLNGVTATVEVTPDYIVVKPQPLLTLDYFLPTQVYADDPFTEEVEPQVPFTLGVRIKNSGGGDAVNTKIESAQPKIVENKQNLLIGFEILGGYVSDEAAGKSLLLDFGNIEAASSKVGRWNMVTTLSGKFIKFDASFTHADHLGGAVTSLLEGTYTHTLVHDIKVDLPGRDNVRDFLALDNDVMRVYESDGIDTIVTNQSANAQFTVGSSQAQLIFNEAPGFVYAKVDDPYHGTKALEIVRRSDGKVIPKENVWLSKVFNQDTTWSYYINVFDVDSTGSYTFFFDQENKALLTGIVYLDANGNGVMDKGEQGLHDVGVTLSVQDGSSTNVVSVIQTNASGGYTFVDLQAGKYALEVSSVNGMNDGVAVAGNADGTVSLGKITGIDLVAGINAKGYFFAKKSTTAPKASISGMVYFDANGNDVMDEGEQGIQDVGVTLSVQDGSGSNEVSVMRSNASGAYTFDGLQAGRYTLEIAPVAGMNDGVAVTGSAGGAASAGEVAGIDLSAGVNAQGYLFAKKAIVAEKSSLSGTVYFDANSNGVMDADESGISLVAVALKGQNKEGADVWKTAFTDELGVYAFDNLQAGQYTLEVSSVSGMNDGIAVVGSAGGAVSTGKVSGIDLSAGVNAKGYLFAKKAIVAQGASISGIVYFDVNGNGVIDGDEKGIGAVDVSLSVQDGSNTNVVSVIQTNTLGAYTFDSLQVGKYTLEVFPVNGMNDGVAMAGSAGGVVAQGKITEVELSAGVNAKGYLFAKKTIVAEKSSISGVVYFDANGDGVMDGAENGIEAAEVSLVSDGEVVSVVQTNATGAYTFDNLQAGRYTLEVAPVAGMNDGVAVAGSAGGVGVLGKITEIELSASVNAQGYLFAKKAIVVEKSSISGVVYFDANGDGVMDGAENGIEAAEVSLVSDGEVVSVVQTNATGAYIFEGLNAGQYTLEVSSVAGMSDGVAIAGSAGGVVTVGKISGIDLSAGVNAKGYLFAKKTIVAEKSSISGVVYLDANGDGVMDGAENGIETAEVSLVSGGEVVSVVQTNALGAYTFDNLQAGKYTLEVSPVSGLTDGAAIAGTVGGTATAGKITGIDLVAGVNAQGYLFAKKTITDPKASISGVVYFDANSNKAMDGDDAGMSLVAVALSGQSKDGADVWKTTFTDETGAYVFEGLQAGQYKLEVASQGWMMDSSSLAGQAGGIAELSKITQIDLNAGVNAQGYQFAKKESIERVRAGAQVFAYIDNATPSVGDTINIRFPSGSYIGSSPQDMRLNIKWPEGLSDISCRHYNGELVHGQWYFESGTEILCSAKVLDLSGEQVITASVSAQTANLVPGFSNTLIPLWAKDAQQYASLIGGVYNDKNGSMAFDGVNEGLANVAVTLSGRDEKNNEVYQVGYTNNLGVFTFTGLNKGVYTLEVEAVEGLSDSLTFIGNAFGTERLGKVSDINLQSGQIGSTYLFAKRVPSEMNADLIIQAAVYDESYMDLFEPLTDVQIGDQLSVLFMLGNDGPDVAVDTTLKINWTNGVREVACYGVDTSDLDNPEAVVLYPEDPLLGTYPALIIENGEWKVGSLRPEQTHTTEVFRYAVCKFKVASLTGNQSITATISSQTLDPDTSNNRHSVIFNQVDASASLAGTVYFDANGNEVMDGDEPGMSLVAVALSGQSKDGANVWKTAFTDEAGAYTFDGLQAGEYKLEVASQGWMMDSSSLAGQAGGVAELGKVTQINLNAGMNAQGYQFAKQESTERDKADVYVLGSIDNVAPSIGDTINARFRIDSFVSPAKGVRFNIMWPEGLSDISCYSLKGDGSKGELVHGQWYMSDDSYSGEINCSAKVVDLSYEQIITASVSSQTANFVPGFSSNLIPLRAKDASLTGVVFNDKNASMALDGVNEGLANVAVTLSGHDESGREVSQVGYTNSLGIFTFTGLSKGVYALEVEAVRDLSDSVASIGNAFGTGELGKINDIKLQSGQLASTYLFAKRQTSELNADLLIFGRAMAENGETVTQITAGQTIYTYFGVVNNGPDIALGTKAKIIWTSGLSDTACYQIILDDGDLTGDELFIENPFFVGHPLLPILNGEWDIGRVDLEGEPGQDIDTDALFALCITNSATTQANQSITATISSQTLDPDTSNNSHSVIFNQVDANASLSGMVYGLSDDGNDVYGIGNVAVELSGKDEEGAEFSLINYTDAAGLFAFSDLIAGRYTLHVQSVGGMLDGAAVIGHAGGITTLGFISNINLGAGVKADEYRFEKRTGVVGTGSLSGTVIYDASGGGAGISGAMISLLGYDNGRRVQQTAYTDIAGAFIFDGLNAGIFSLNSEHVDGTVNRSQKAGTSGGGQEAMGKMNNIRLKEGMRAQNYFFTKRILAGGASISGKVYFDANGNGMPDSSEAGIAGSSVWLLGAGTDVKIYTDASGNFAFNNLVKGYYALSADYVGGTWFDGVMVPGTGGGKKNPEAISDIILADETKVEGYYFGYQHQPRSSSITGTVYADMNGNGVFDGDEIGIGGAKLLLRGQEEIPGLIEFFAHTDASGKFLFNGLRKGSYNLSVGLIGGTAEGIVSIGTEGGTITVNGEMSINLRAANGMHASGYNFAKLDSIAKGAPLDSMTVVSQSSNEPDRVRNTGTCLLNAQNSGAAPNERERTQQNSDQPNASIVQADAMAQHVSTDCEETK